jgi:hypothetical protein
MTLRLVSRSLAVFASIASLCLTPAATRAQVVGENVNMVSGTEWPGGDPFLQRQNEPTMAVSSVNSQHLMAGANDYRSVDVPDPAYGEMAAGDAWLGVFKSLDGGQTWKSVLLPGYPQDQSAVGLASPLKTWMKVPATFTPDVTKQVQVKLPGAADPVMRAGTDGMFYFLGINFARDRSVSRLFLGRFIDQNNKENGDATQGTDPVRYLDTRIIAKSTDTGLNGGKQIFIDKPWMVVDVPRDTTHTCTVPDPEKPATRTAPEGTKQILAGTIYVGWAQFAPGDVSSDIMLTSSTNCGVSWATPRKLNTSNSKINQGVALGIEPVTGRLIVAWRRVASGKQSDAIMATRANGRKKPFAAPRVVAKLVNFDLGTGLGQARTQTMPSMAISSDGKVSYVHLAWSARAGAGGPSRIWMSSAKILTPPSGDNDADEPDDYEPETRVKWTTAATVNVGDVVDDFGHKLTRGHQYMPALTASQGRLVLFYYDSRLDHTRRYFRPNAPTRDPLNPTKLVWAPDPDGKFYKEELGPIGELANPASTTASLVFGNTPGADFNDSVLTGTRHTVDVRVGMAQPSLSPSFSSVLVSRFPFGITGEETNIDYSSTATPLPTIDYTAVGFVTGTNLAPVVDPAAKPGSILIVPKAENEVKVLQQLHLNPPGFPMFKGSTAAFMGDYIDVQGQNFAVVTTTTSAGTKSRWAFNTAASSAPVFHAVWTSNQDVKTPPYGSDGKPDWSKYTPVSLYTVPGRSMLYDGGRADPNISNPNISNTPVAVCDPASTGSRDQNIYTARITEGLQVSTPQNTKILDPSNPVGFVIAAANSTGLAMTVRFGVPTTGAGSTGAPSFSYSTDFANPVSTVDAQIAPHSSVFRTLFVKQGISSAPTIFVTVTESAGCGGSGQPVCRSGSLTFNPPIAISSLVAPDGTTQGATGTVGEFYAAAVGAPNISNPNISNPNISNPNISNPNISNPNISNPNISNPNVANPNISNPNISNPNISNPNISNPNISNPNISNPNISNPNISNSALSDANYTFTNTGNTNASYFVKVVGDASKVTSPLQLIVSKTYKTPTSVGCDLIEVAHDQVVVSVPDISKDIVAPTDPVATGVETPNISNATLSLAPGETATVTLRGYVPLTEMAKTMAAVTPAPVPATAPPTPVPGNPTYETWGATAGNAPLVKTPTVTTITQDGAVTYASVAPQPGYPNFPRPLGTVTFVRTRAGVDTVLAVLSIVDFHGDSPFFTTNPLTGDNIVVIYGGDDIYAASSSNAVVAAAPQVLTTIEVDDRGAGGKVTLKTENNVPITSGATVKVTSTIRNPATNTDVVGIYDYFHVGGGVYQYTGMNVPNAIFGAIGGTVTVDVQVVTPSSTSTVHASGAIPSSASIVSPTLHTLFATGSDVMVNWTNPNSAYVTGYYSLTYVTSAGYVTISPIPPGASTRTIPGGQVISGGSTISMQSANFMTFGGDAAPGSTGVVTKNGDSTSIWTGTGVGSATMGYPRFTHAVGNGGVSNGSKLYVIGGMSNHSYTAPITAVEVYDIPTGTWTTVGAGPVTSFFQANVEVGTGLRLIGGQSTGTMQDAVSSYQAYSTYFNSWTANPTGMNTARTMAAAAPMIYVPNSPTDPIWMVSGGFNSTGTLDSAETMNGYLQWVTVAPMTTARRAHAAAQIGTRYYAIGGQTDSASAIASVEYYDKSTGIWTAGPDLPVALFGAAAAVVGSKIYVMGGANSGWTVSNLVFVLDTLGAPVAWVPATNLPVAVIHAAAAVVGNTIYLVGGDAGGTANPYGSIQTIVTP